MKYAILMMLVLCWPVTAFGQTFYEPPRYQFGRHNEIYYGGTGTAPESARSLPARPATIRTQIFSDYFPLFREVGRFGFTIDDARHEAYANVPRFFTMAPPSSPPPTVVKLASAAHPRFKAVPLLNWAKVEYVRNPALFKALIHEAAKHDPKATAALVKQLQQPVRTGPVRNS